MTELQGLEWYKWSDQSKDWLNSGKIQGWELKPNKMLQLAGLFLWCCDFIRWKTQSDEGVVYFALLFLRVSVCHGGEGMVGVMSCKPVAQIPHTLGSRVFTTGTRAGCNLSMPILGDPLLPAMPHFQRTPHPPKDSTPVWGQAMRTWACVVSLLWFDTEIKL